MIDAALPYLRCPIGEEPLARAERTLRCAAGHSFDLARQGYANLSTGRMPHDGDTAEMVADRDAFLTAGHYDFIADALATYPEPTKDQPAKDQTAEERTPETQKTEEHNPVPVRPPTRNLVVDAGTGTGYYLAHTLAGTDRIGLGLDVSKAALRRAARAHPDAAAVLTDLWRPLPIRDGSAALLLNVFAPRNGPEFHRVLRPDGVLLVVTPAADHLADLIAEHGLIHVDPDKADRVAESLGAHFTVRESQELRRPLDLTAAEVRTLIGMTPSARHLSAIDLPTTSRKVTAAVTLTAYVKKI